VYNTGRTSADSPTVTAFDFVRDDESSRQRERLLDAKRFIRNAMGMPRDATREQFLEKRLCIIADLQAGGYADAEQIFNEMWPSLKPTAPEKE
jgi:hypothetical protein